MDEDVKTMDVAIPAGWTEEELRLAAMLGFFLDAYEPDDRLPPT